MSSSYIHQCHKGLCTVRERMEVRFVTYNTRDYEVYTAMFGWVQLLSQLMYYLVDLQESQEVGSSPFFYVIQCGFKFHQRWVNNRFVRDYKHTYTYKQPIHQTCTGHLDL